MRLGLIATGRASWTWKAAVPLLGLGAAFAAGLFARQGFQHRPAAAATAADEPAVGKADQAKAKGEPNAVTLPEEKVKIAGIATEAARLVAVPAEVVVSCTIEADAEKRVDIRPRAAGIVRTVTAQPGQKVKAGAVLATVDSAEVGLARLNLRSRLREMATDRTEAEWRDRIAANVADLIAALAELGDEHAHKHGETSPAPARLPAPPTTAAGRPEAPKPQAAAAPAAAAGDEVDREIIALEKSFAGRPMGTYRGQIFAAYAEGEIAEHDASHTSDLFKKGIIGHHPYTLAANNRYAAAEKYEGTVDQIKFDAAQQKRIADQALRQSEGLVVDARARLRLLGVDEPLPDVSRESIGDAEADDLTLFRVVAPFDATVLSRSAVPSTAVEPAQVLFALADMSTVWARATIPEDDLKALPSLGGGTFRFATDAYPGRGFEATVLYVGAQFDPVTRALPLLAAAANPDGLLILGMAGRVTLAGAPGAPVLTVPSAAVVELDGKPVVFVPGREPRSYLLRHVDAGRDAEGRRIILSGLRPGDLVVSAGAFTVKSELILQSEQDEE